MVRLVLWCLDVPSDVAGWARRNTPVPVGRGVGAAPCGELVAPRMPQVGLWRTGVPGSVAAPLPLMDAVNCLRGVRPSYHSHRSYVSYPYASQAFNSPAEVRAGPCSALISGCSPWTVILWPVVR